MVWTKAFLIALLLSNAAFAQLTPTPGAEDDKAKTITWRHVYKDALAEAQKANKPLLIDFYADWCGPCKMMEAQTFPDPRVIKAVQDFVAVKVDIDNDQQTAFAYQIRSIPRTIVLNVYDEMVGDRVGFMGSDAFLTYLEDVKEFTHKKVDGIVISVPDAPGNPSSKAAQISKETESSELRTLFSDRDPKVRAAARKELFRRSDEDLGAFLKAGFQSEYLGTRIATLEAFLEISPYPSEFDPWASKETRDAALAEELELER